MTMRVFMFPGQSSADPDMLVRAVRIHSAARAVADRARLALGDTLASRYRPNVPGRTGVAPGDHFRATVEVRRAGS